MTAPKKPRLLKRLYLAVTNGYYGGVPTHISSPDESFGFFIQNDGALEIRHVGGHTVWIYRP